MIDFNPANSDTYQQKIVKAEIKIQTEGSADGGTRTELANNKAGLGNQRVAYQAQLEDQNITYKPSKIVLE